MKPWMTLLSAHVATPLFDEISLVLAILLSMAGLALHLYQPRHQMTVEERVKDSKLTEAEARRQVRFYRLMAPAVTLIGVGLLVLALYDMAQ
jgi:hypothetical protein